MNIYLSGDWVSFFSVVLENLEGENLPTFYELLFRLSARFDGFKLGITPDGKFIVLQSEISLKGLEYSVKLEKLQFVIKWFYLFHLQYLPRIIKYAAKLKLVFRDKNNHAVDSMMEGFSSISIDTQEKSTDVTVKKVSETQPGKNMLQSLL